MLDILFGWRKASKCKKVIRKVQCRLKLLMNKRCCIVKQSQHDVAQLIKHGHHQTALQRVEQLFKDQSMVQVYDLLTNYCEFIIINLHYIRKHKTCPEDVMEAVSALIFSSARIGNLPELVILRKLFKERYGKKFVTAALQSSPANLVNHQIEESLYIKTVPDDVKYRLLDEISSSLVEPGPLLLEYSPYFQPEKATNTSSIEITNRDVQRNNLSKVLQGQIIDTTEAKGKVLRDDLASESTESSKPMTEDNFQIVKQNSAPGEVDKTVKLEVNNFAISCDSGSAYGVGSVAEDSSSEASAQPPDEMIYLDDIEEFITPVCKNGEFQDQRLFVFKSVRTPRQEKDGCKKAEEEGLATNERSVSRSSRKMRRSSRKRLRRRRSISQENRNVTDVECAIYYGESDDESFDNKYNSHHQKQYGNKSPMVEGRNAFDAHKRPSRIIVKDRRSSFSLIEDIVKDSMTHILEKEKIQYGMELCRYSFKDEPKDKDNNVPYSRAMSMPNERPNPDNICRFNSFPFEQHRDDRSPSCRHIHPKLPDYDELAEKFMALKRQNILNKKQESNQ